MKPDEYGGGCRACPGVVLPVIVVMLTVLLVCVLAVVTLTDVERRSLRGWGDQQQAKLAVEAGLEKVRMDLLEAASNDRYLVVGSLVPEKAADGRRSRMYSYLVTPDREGGAYRYQYLPLFSSEHDFADTSELEVPKVPSPSADGGESWGAVDSQPWLDPALVEWLPVRDDRGRVVARFAYWLEDLQAMMEASLVGNRDGDDGRHRRVEYPHPAAGVADGFGNEDPVMGQVALYALDELPNGDLPDGPAGLLPERRHVLVSPEATLAAAGIQPPLVRLSTAQSGRYIGELSKTVDARIEQSMTVGLQPYFEQPLVPHAVGISPLLAGKPRLNLNQLLADDRSGAVTKMARWVERGLPEFDLRSGGFPDDYLETLAANALDYADADRNPTNMAGRCIGIDGQPFLSEVVLHIHFRRLQYVDGRWVMSWRFRLFAELWNMSNVPIEGGQVRLSYEVNLRPSPTGLGGSRRAFDDPVLLNDPTQSSHQLERIGDRYFTPPLEVSLRPNEYRFHEFAMVDYTIDHEPQFDGDGQPLPEAFALVEPWDGMRGLSLLWNGVRVQRLNRIMRDAYGLSHFRTDRSRKAAKACIPGLNYGALGAAVNNMGDPRIAGYLRGEPLGENAYPDNLSPHRRNIRRRNIYDKDPDPRKTRHYGRVLPSQWPDGGHDSATGDFYVTTSHAALPTDPLKWPLSGVPEPVAEEAPQRLSNAGRFFSATELGRVFDPVMWTPVYPDRDDEPGSGVQDTKVLNGYGIGRPAMPVRRMSWPEVSRGSSASIDHGGGNTLRIGRPEHDRFDRPGRRAAQWLDLFHVGVATSADEAERQGPVVLRHGHVNVNTAGREVLRCLVAGALGQDPLLARVVDWNHDTDHALAPVTEQVGLDAPEADGLAGMVADAVIRSRPFASLSELAAVKRADGKPVFGNKDVYQDGDELQWSDAAAEEVFARVHAASTVRSRHFRVWVVGQSLEGPAGKPEVMAEYRRVFGVFIDPGERNEDGSLVPEESKTRVLYERNF